MFPRRKPKGEIFLEIITSRSNRRIVEYSKLRDKKYRELSGLFCFEGDKLLREAVDTGIALKAVFFREDRADLAQILPPEVERYAVSDAVYEKLTGEKSPQGVFCAAKRLTCLHRTSDALSGEDFPAGGRYFLAEGVRDPGNLGTILRSACAMGLNRLILSDDCADLYNPKTVRAAMGALFRLPTLRVRDCPAAVTSLREAGVRVYAGVLDAGALDVRRIDCSGGGVCFAVGNEGHGLSGELIAACTGRVRIPMRPGCESLNAAGASAILLWELSGRLLEDFA